MSRWHRHVRVAAAAVLAGVLLLAMPSAATPAPNPFGDRSTSTSVVLHRDGSYDVTLRQAVELTLPYDLTLGGSGHDGFRLADDATSLPPYLRATYTLTAFALSGGQPGPTEFTRTHHLVSASSTGSYPAGTHTAEIRYRVTNAARPTSDGYQVHLRLLGTGSEPGERVVIDAAELGASRLDLRCVTFAPDTEACGTTDGSTITASSDPDQAPTLPPEYRIDVTADNAAVPEPTIDRG
jgi:hypothetical protein